MKKHTKEEIKKILRNIEDNTSPTPCLKLLYYMKIKQCCSCEKVFKYFLGKKGCCPFCSSGNWVYGYIDDFDENMKCEVCGKSKADVRFEGSEEKNICDKCLFEEKQYERKEN